MHIFFELRYISRNISLKQLKFGMHKDITHVQGTVSQIYHLCPSFLFMKSRKITGVLIPACEYT